MPGGVLMLIKQQIYETVITDYTEDMGILNYSSSTFIICPVDYDLSRYREIPLEEDGRYLEEQIRELERQKDVH